MASLWAAQFTSLWRRLCWRLFCLQFSFIGWGILSALTLGIGDLWLTPYKQAATAAFYRDVSGTEYAAPAPAYLDAPEGEVQ